MTKRRVQNLMRRAGVEIAPLDHCRTIAELNAELSKLSDSQFLLAWSKAHGARATRLSDEELLLELETARRQADQEEG
jgi:hypothetical protein